MKEGDMSTTKERRKGRMEAEKRGEEVEIKTGEIGNGG